MTGRIFLNYRRTDAEAWADRLFERLTRQFPRENIFMDIDGDIPIGFSWAEWLDKKVATCDLMVVLIGRTWIEEFKARSQSHNPDFVRVEIESALARKIPVVPVLLGDAPVPRSADLPETIRPLLALQAARLQRGLTFNSDSDALVMGIARSIALARGEDPARGPVGYRAEGRIKVKAKHVYGAPDGWFKPGDGKTEWFKDIDAGPEMIVVPAEQPFAIGRYALAFDEWDAAQVHPDWQKHSGIAPRKANDHGWGRGRQPAIHVSWEDAKAYCSWLSKMTATTYRLPTEAEWEHCCRAGTTTEFWRGNEISTAQANYDGNFTFGNGKKGEHRNRTVPVHSFEANPWGLYQVHGNVWEWCEDADAKSFRVLRGGSWGNDPVFLRSSIRSRNQPDYRDNGVGFRLARTL